MTGSDPGGLMRWLLQAVGYAAFGTLVVVFSASPAYQYASPGTATIKLSISHAAARVEPCVRLTPEQIAQLAPNMRRVEQCERRRMPLFLEIDIDGSAIARVEAPPSGLWGDGAASVYARIDLQPGEHELTARLRDSSRESGWDYVRTERVVLQPGRYFTISFDAATGGFLFR